MNQVLGMGHRTGKIEKSARRRCLRRTERIFVFVLAGMCFIHVQLSGQQTLTWDELADVKFTSVQDAEFGIEVLTADFGAHIESLDSQFVRISGYMIPLNPMGTSYVLSRFPNANCFFCGGAGPETIVELKLKPGQVRRYATDTFATFRGRLVLSERNVESFNYVLADAEKED